MPFQKGNRLGKGGRKKGAGRPSREQAKNKQTAAEIAREYIEQHVQPVLANYLKLANGWNETRYSDGLPYEAFCYDGATTRHFVDKVLPEIKVSSDEQPRPVYFIQFNSTNGALQLPAEGLPDSILVSNGNGHQERGEGVASEIGKRQDGLEFHSFAHVSRKRG